LGREKKFRTEATFTSLDGKHIDAIICFYIPATAEGFSSIAASSVDFT
jgi:hypothetical protein